MFYGRLNSIAEGVVISELLDKKFLFTVHQKPEFCLCPVLEIEVLNELSLNLNQMGKMTMGIYTTRLMLPKLVYQLVLFWG